jgi:hypothetical protein
MHSNFDRVRLRILHDLADRVVVFRAGELVLVPRKTAVPLVRAGLAEYEEPERALIGPTEKAEA